jgi:predicted HicB family RNase H-like nuclease
MVPLMDSLGIQKVVADVVAGMRATGQPVPAALAEKYYSGEFRVRIPPMGHRQVTMLAAEQGVSLNRLASVKLAS